MCVQFQMTHTHIYFHSIPGHKKKHCSSVGLGQIAQTYLEHPRIHTPTVNMLHLIVRILMDQHIIGVRCGGIMMCARGFNGPVTMPDYSRPPQPNCIQTAGQKKVKLSRRRWLGIGLGHTHTTTVCVSIVRPSFLRPNCDTEIVSIVSTQTLIRFSTIIRIDDGPGDTNNLAVLWIVHTISIRLPMASVCIVRDWCSSARAKWKRLARLRTHDDVFVMWLPFEVIRQRKWCVTLWTKCTHGLVWPSGFVCVWSADVL